jgi:glycosyltransferase involved in cell wall biosynthesis
METSVAYLITDSGTGGSEKALLTVLSHLDRQRFNPRAVLVLKKKREMATLWARTGVPVEEFGMGRWPSPWLFLRVWWAIRRRKPRIVHAFLYHSIQIARLIHLFDRSFALITSPRVNYQFAPKPALWLDRWLRGQDALALCESEAGRRSLVKSLGYPEDRVMVAWNSVDTAKFAFDPTARERVRKEWGIAPDEILIGSIGRLHQQKGYDLLIDALSELQGGHGAYKAVVVGDGPEKDDLDTFALAKSVPLRFVGERTDIPAVLSAFDIYVQSSRYEGLSNALLEAMSVGRACLATAVDGTLDFAKDGENMVLARPESSSALALGLATLIEKPTLRERLSGNAKITAAQFSVQKMLKGFEEAYVRTVS